RLQAVQGADGLALGVLEVGALVVLGRVVDRGDERGGGGDLVGGGTVVRGLHLDRRGELAAGGAGQRRVTGADERVGCALGDRRLVLDARQDAADDDGTDGERAGRLARPERGRHGDARRVGDGGRHVLTAGEGGVGVAHDGEADPYLGDGLAGVRLGARADLLGERVARHRRERSGTDALQVVHRVGGRRRGRGRGRRGRGGAPAAGGGGPGARARAARLVGGFGTRLGTRFGARPGAGLRRGRSGRGRRGAPLAVVVAAVPRQRAGAVRDLVTALAVVVQPPQDGVQIVRRVVVAEDGLPQVAPVGQVPVVAAQVVAGGEGRVVDVVGVLAPVTVAVAARPRPGGGDELHGAD